MIDENDLKILKRLQSDCSVRLQELAQDTGLSISASRQKLKNLKEKGYIREQVYLLDNEKLGFSLTAFLMLKVSNHSEVCQRAFIDNVCSMDAVVGFFQTTGEYDYLLKVLVNDVKAFDEFYKSLISSVVGVRKIMTSFSMEKIKDTTKLPIF